MNAGKVLKKITGQKRENKLFDTFSNVMDMTKALTCIIDELVDDRDLKETIISYVPKDEKKGQILSFVKREVNRGNISVLEGFRNTIKMLEKEFR